MSIDRLPPQSIDAEQSVIGSLLIDRDAVIEVADFLRPQDFYRQAHGTIYDEVHLEWTRESRIMRTDGGDHAEITRAR